MDFLFFKLGIFSILIWTICSVLSYPTQDNSRNCIKMTPENRAKIQRIKHELAKMLTEYGDNFDDIDIRFVKIDIYKHSDDEDPEQDMVLEFYVNNCENSFNWNAFEETYEFDTDDDKDFENGGKDVIKEQAVLETHEIQSEEIRNRQIRNEEIISTDTENRDNRQENVRNIEEYKETQSIEKTRKVEKSEKITNFNELDEQTNVDNRKCVKKERNVSNLETDDEYINIENRKIVKKHENVINTEIIDEENTTTGQNIKTTNNADTQTENVETKTVINQNTAEYNETVNVGNTQINKKENITSRNVTKGDENECQSCIENSKRETENQNTEDTKTKNGNINNDNSKIVQNNENVDKNISKTDTAKNKCKKSKKIGITAEANDKVNNLQNQESDIKNINEFDAETIMKHLQAILLNNKNINIEAICKNMENFQNSKIHNADTNTVVTKETNINNTLTENTNSVTNNQNTETTNINSETTNIDSETTNINSETSNTNVKTTNINSDTRNTNSETTNTDSETTKNSETINKNIINSFTEISNKETNTQKTSETNINNDKTANYPITLSTIPFTESPKIDTLNINEILISLKNIFKAYELNTPNTRNNEPQTNINYIFFYDGFHRQFRYPMSEVNGNNNVQLNEMNLKSDQKRNCENEVIVKPRNEASFNTENYKRMLESFYGSYVNYNANLAGAKPEFFDVNFNKKCN